MQSPKERAASLIRIAAMVGALALPSLTLVPLGSLWLWEHGYLLHWAVATALLMTLSYVWQRWLLKPRPTAPVAPTRDPEMVDANDAADPAWNDIERRAWRDVLAIARNTPADRLASREDMLAVATRTITAVAMRLHPEVKEPIWQFTVPEALAITERVSRRLGRFVYLHVPLSDRLTVARVLSFYRWRGAVDIAERAYDVWRVVRLANPMAAATNELRERLSRQILQWGREHVARQVTEVYIKEIGRAAIDLYGGRIQVGAVYSPDESDVAEPSEDVRPPRGKLSRLGSQSMNAFRAILGSIRMR